MADTNDPITLTGDITPVAQGLKANLDALPKGTNKLFHTFFGKKHADALRYEMLTAAQTNADIKKISSGEAAFLNGEIVGKKQSDQITIDSPTSFLQLKMEEEADNLHGCMREAIKDSLNQKEEASSTPITEKFFSRWRSEAVHISDHEEQQLWGRVLSEENQRGGTFSLSTIDVLRNIDKDSAEIFSTICAYVVFGDHIILNDDCGIDSAIDTKALLRLAELGLLSISTPVRLATDMPTMLFCNEKTYYLEVEPYLVLIDSRGKKLSFIYAKLTTAGKEIRKVATNIDENAIQNICRLLFKLKDFEKIEKISFGKYEIPVTNNHYSVGELQHVTREPAN